MRIEGIGPGYHVSKPSLRQEVAPGTQRPTFKDTLNTFLKDVNTMQNVASDAQKKLLTGETTDVHQVMNKSEEAKVAFNMMMEMRNKAMEAYQEIMRMRL
jgi:flagellar hook-basal body complex protein FliE